MDHRNRSLGLDGHIDTIMCLVLDNKKYSSWRARGESLRRSAVESIMRHASNCQECFDKINSVYVHAALEEQKKHTPKELEEIERQVMAEFKRYS